jgi:energy-coupling factor transport system permease protein
MLADITFGQYFPAKSYIHRMDPRLKIVLTIFFIVLTFCSKNFVCIALVYVAVIASMIASKVPAKTYIRSLKPILFIVAFTVIINLFYGTGEPLIQIWTLKITLNGILNSFLIAIRIVALIFVSSVLTFTTSPTQLTDAIERLLKPLAKMKVPVHEFAMMMTIALRFVPTLLEETDKIMSAQKARGADMESGGVMQRIKALVPVLIPLFVSAFRRAFDLATAMESRCYTGGEGRTKMKILKISKEDIFTIVGCVIFLAVFVVANITLPKIVR